MTFSRFYDLVWRGSVFTCGSCQVNGGNDVFSPRRLFIIFSTMRLDVVQNLTKLPRLYCVPGWLFVCGSLSVTSHIIPFLHLLLSAAEKV